MTSGKPGRKRGPDPQVFPNPRGSRYLRLLLTCPSERQELPAKVLSLLPESGLSIDRCVIEADTDGGVIDIDLETTIPDSATAGCQDLIERVRALPGADLRG